MGVEVPLRARFPMAIVACITMSMLVAESNCTKNGSREKRTSRCESGDVSAAKARKWDGE
jgi:hypothetical protein